MYYFASLHLHNNGVRKIVTVPLLATLNYWILLYGPCLSARSSKASTSGDHFFVIIFCNFIIFFTLLS